MRVARGGECSAQRTRGREEGAPDRARTLSSGAPKGLKGTLPWLTAGWIDGFLTQSPRRRLPGLRFPSASFFKRDAVGLGKGNQHGRVAQDGGEAKILQRRRLPGGEGHISPAFRRDVGGIVGRGVQQRFVGAAIILLHQLLIVMAEENLPIEVKLVV